MAGTNIYGELIRAQLQNLSADPSGPVSGLMYFNTTSSVKKWYTGAAWKTAVDTDSTQTLTNKSIVATQITGQLAATNGGTGISSTATFPSSGIVVTEAATETLTNKTLGSTNTLTGATASSFTNTGTVSLFTATDTVVGKATTDTLTNKSLSGSTNTFTNIPAATAITGQLPSANGGTGVNSTATFPTSGVVVTEAATETLTNKTLTAPTQSTYEQFTSQAADPGAPASAGDARLYVKSKFLYTQDSDGTVTQVGAGSGGRNYLSQDFFGNSVGTVGTANVTDTGNRSTATMAAWQASTAASLSISTSGTTPLRETGSFLTTGAGQNAAGTLFIESKGFNLDNVDLGKAVVLSFDVSGSTLSTDWDVCVVRYNSSGTFQEKISVAGTASTGTPATATLPTGTSTFRGFFVSSSTQTDYYAVRWRRLANAVNIRLDSLFVGPQSLSLGFAGTDWQSFTPTLNTGVRGTNTELAYWRRVGDSMEILYTYKQTGAGTAGSGTYTWSIPAGYTIDTSKLVTGTASVGSVVGSGYFYDGTNERSVIVLPNSSTAFGVAYFTSATGSANLASTSSPLSTAIFTLVVYLKVPISTWTSNNTTADRSVEEYAYNTSTSTSANDFTSFGNGPSGAQIQNITAVLTRRVQFNSPIQATDALILEMSTDRIKWLPLSQSAYINNQLVLPLITENSTSYGAGALNQVSGSSTQIEVAFGTYAGMFGKSSVGGAGQAWSTAAGSGYWRVRKVSGGASVGFPVGTQNIVGRTDGVAPSAGYIGEVISSNATGVSVTTSPTNVASALLTAGVWDVVSTAMNNGAGGNGLIFVGTSATSASMTGLVYGKDKMAIVCSSTLGAGGGSVPPVRVTLSAPTTYYCVASYNTSTNATDGSIRAVRIA